jgi:hypothetical protein
MTTPVEQFRAAVKLVVEATEAAIIYSPTFPDLLDTAMQCVEAESCKEEPAYPQFDPAIHTVSQSEVPVSYPVNQWFEAGNGRAYVGGTVRGAYGIRPSMPLTPEPFQPMKFGFAEDAPKTATGVQVLLAEKDAEISRLKCRLASEETAYRQSAQREEKTFNDYVEVKATLEELTAMVERCFKIVEETLPYDCRGESIETVVTRLCKYLNRKDRKIKSLEPDAELGAYVGYLKNVLRKSPASYVGGHIQDTDGLIAVRLEKT